LFLFLLAAMTYINAMEERNVFQALRAFLVSRGFSLRVIFWLTVLPTQESGDSDGTMLIYLFILVTKKCMLKQA
jgi:Na+/H+ antiporter NhaD/arsenite permease-like protein